MWFKVYYENIIIYHSLNDKGFPYKPPPGRLEWWGVGLHWELWNWVWSWSWYDV